jgi:hypothetical protein
MSLNQILGTDIDQCLTKGRGRQMPPSPCEPTQAILVIDKMVVVWIPPSSRVRDLDKVTVLGFLLHQDEDHLMPAIIDPVRVLSSGRLRWRTRVGDMPGDCWIGWYLVVRTMFFLTVWF